MARRDHHIVETVDPVKLLRIDLQQSVAVGDRFDLSFLDFGRTHAGPCGPAIHRFCEIILVNQVRIVLPDEQIFLPHGQERRNIFFGNPMPFSETGALRDSRNDLGHVLTQNKPDSVFSLYLFHIFSEWRLI